MHHEETDRREGLRSRGNLKSEIAKSEMAGFTLLEILISMVILMVGLLGILAVFPTAMRAAARAVEDTYCASIAQSVIDAIHLGMRTAHARYDEDRAFILLDHDGVVDLETDRDGLLASVDLEKPASWDQLLGRDYCIRLPSHTELAAANRGKAYLFPRERPQDNAAGKGVVMVRGPNGDKPEIKKVYELGKKLGTDMSKTEQTREIERRDPYPQYGFAFTVRRTKAPTPEAPEPNLSAVAPRKDVMLYEIVVLVFRNFRPEPMSKYNDPVREFVTYVAE